MSSIKELAPTRRGKFQQGYYNPRNHNKYLGDLTKIIFRSSWEYKYMVYCDLSEHVVQWSSETIRVPYISPVDGKKHIYNVDFLTRVKIGDVVTTYLVEVKPSAQYTDLTKLNENKSKPISKKPSKKRLETEIREQKTIAVNNAKFNYAKKYADDRGWVFKVITEEDLGIENSKKKKAR